MPMWNDIYITENIKYDGTEKVENLGELIHFKNYNGRFKELATSGWPWINLNAVGLYKNNLILSVEVPNREPEGANITSVNISGPSKSVTNNGFVVDEK